MSFRKYLTRFVLCALAAAFTLPAIAQTDQPLTWAQDIAYMQKLTPEEALAQQSTIRKIRADVELWIKVHPGSNLQLAAAPAQPFTAEGGQAEIKELNRVITAIVDQDPTHPFHLGTVNVNVTASASPLSPLADTIDQTEIAKRNEVNAASAMENLPGVSITHTYSGRNQEQISIHGFSYLQVPLYVDGILMNDPYDSTLDFRQIPTTDIAEIQVAKGFSSALMGPNAVGGAINIVTKEPQKKYEGEMLTGGYSGDGFISSIRLGSRAAHYFVEGSLDWTQADYIPLSSNFVTNYAQANNQLNHTDSHDAKYTGRIGWTPNSRSEYVFSYLNQKANGGIPLSAGNDPLDGTGCGSTLSYSNTSYTNSNLTTCYFNSLGKMTYRTWKYWDKTSYYFHSNTALGDKSSLKMRVFYDQYPNRMNDYTDDTYTTLNPGFITGYDDHADGFSTEFDTKLVKRNTISGSFYFKDDTHKEYPMELPPSGSRYAFDRQQTASIGLQDVISITDNLSATVGMNFDHLDGLRATDTGESTYVYQAFVSPKCPSNTDTSDYQACTPHVWAYNPQVSLAYNFKDSSRLFFGFAQKSRFPGMKEMYSYKTGKSVPNPTLKTEHSQNWEVGYSRIIARNTTAQVEYFYSSLKDAIESVAAPPSIIDEYSGTSSCTSPAKCTVSENATHEAHQGAELTVHSAPLKKLSFDANYTYVNKKIDGFSYADMTDEVTTKYSAVSPCYTGGVLMAGTGSNAEPTTTPDNTCLTPTDLPRNKAVATATLEVARQIMLNSTLRYEGGNKQVDSYSYTYYEAIPMSHFATWDMGVTAPLFKGTEFQAGVKNLLDRNYYQALDIPEEGRNWFINMRYRF